MSIERIILVTGGGGFLGGAIVRRLVARNERVRSFSRTSYPWLSQLGVEQICGDLADADAVSRACRNVEAVFHTAARAGVWGSFESFYQPNVIGTHNMIAACRENGVQRLIYTSSPSVVFDGHDMQGVNESVPYPAHYEAHYPRTKALAEQAVRRAAADGLPSLILRPHLIWGPGDPHLVPRILARAGRLRKVGGGGNRVDTIYIENAAYAHILAEEKIEAVPALSGRVYFISQDEPVGLWEIIDRILAAGGFPPVRKTISARLAWTLGWVCEVVYDLFGWQSEPPMTRFVAGELSTSHWFDISAAKTDLGYRPLISIDDGLKALAEWLARDNR